MGVSKEEALVQTAKGVDKADSEASDADAAENSAKEEIAELRDKMKNAKALQDRTLSAYDDLDRTVRQVLAPLCLFCHALLRPTIRAACVLARYLHRRHALEAFLLYLLLYSSCNFCDVQSASVL
jgi:hypothetical protein